MKAEKKEIKGAAVKINVHDVNINCRWVWYRGNHCGGQGSRGVM